MKYFIKDSDQEVKLGQVIEVEQKVNTSLGEGICKTKVEVTPENIGLLVKQGFLVQKDEKKEEEFNLEAHWQKLKPYIRRFARKNDMPLTAALLFLASLEEVSPIANIQVLLETISEVKNRDKSATPTVFYLSPSNGFKPVIMTLRTTRYCPKFFSKSDAEEAYELIKPFLAALHE